MHTNETNGAKEGVSVLGTPPVHTQISQVTPGKKARQRQSYDADGPWTVSIPVRETGETNPPGWR